MFAGAIVGTAFVSNTDGEVFIDNLNENIEKMQEKNLKVEIQYQNGRSSEELVLFSALIIGRER